jgi:hypothetical protein
MITVTMTCRIPGCFARITWEDDAPSVGTGGAWTVSRKAPPEGWHLANPVPNISGPYTGTLLENANGFCPSHAAAEVKAGRAVP